MSKLRLAMACWNYDRTRALLEDRIPIDGIDLTYINLPVEETFFRMIRHREFDVAEMSLSSYTLSMFKDPKPFVAIPVFPSRYFRHSCIYINRNSGIREPKDLIGKRVGNPEYQLTAGVWIRGILSDDFKVPVSSVTYFRGGKKSRVAPRSLLSPCRRKFVSNPLPKTRPSRRCFVTARSTLSTRPARRPALRKTLEVCGAYLSITQLWKRSITSGRRFSRSCTRL